MLSEKRKKQKRESYIRNREHALDYKRKNRERDRKTSKLWRKNNKNFATENRQSNFTRYLGNKLHASRDVDKKLNRENNIDLPYLLDLLELQNYKCARMGVQLTHKFGDVRAVSIDRIDSTKGHIKGNVQLVCQFYNIGKREKPDSDCQSLIQEIEMNLLKELKRRGYLKLGQVGQEDIL